MTDPNTRTIAFGGQKTYTVDRYGYLDPPEQWDDGFAKGIAGTLGIHGGLTEEHWTLIRYLRKKFVDEKTVPLLILACAENRMRLSRLRYLFPTGYHRGACKIAGINYAFMLNDNFLHTVESYTTIKAELNLSTLGFLEEFDQWDERFANLVASEWNLPNGLTGRHHQIIGFLRNYYRDHKNIPTIFETCRSNDLSLDELHTLFPAGYRRGACRIAGLPFPA